MNLLDVYEGRLTWADYLRRPSPLAQLLPGAASLKLALSEPAYQTALTSGLGGTRLDNGNTRELELDSHSAQLNADFTPLLGDAVWRLELQHSTLLDVLAEIRLAEFERAARAYRTRAERAYLNGWYAEALSDFLKAERRNYPDFAVLRSIANIYLYHSINLPQALAYFRKAAKYARPCDARQAAEAHYFAGLVCLLEQQSAAALNELREAAALLPQFHEAHYQRAAVAARLGHVDEAVASLEIAIHGDARYYERVKTDEWFTPVRAQVQALLARLEEPVQQRVAEVKQDAAQLQGFVIASEEQGKLIRALQELEQQAKDETTYQDRLQLLERLTQLQSDLQHIHERFDKRYALDPRDYVRAIAFSHDGRTLAAGFLHGGVQMWEVDSMLPVQRFSGHFASVNSVAFSPNDLLLATGSRDRAVKLWEADTGRELQILRGHDAEVRAVAFSPDGQWLVSGSHDKTIRIWRAATGHEVETLRGHTRPVTSVVFAPGGELLASGSWDHTIMLWDLQTGRASSLLSGHRKGVAALTISPDGRWLASGGEGGEVKLWDLRAGREVRSYAGLRNSVTSIAFNPDGTLLAAGSLGVKVMVWQTATAEVVRQLQYENISYNSVAFSPRGHWLALGSRDLQLWLKAILTEEEYAAVKAGEERAARVAREQAEKALPSYISMLADV